MRGHLAQGRARPAGCAKLRRFAAAGLSLGLCSVFLVACGNAKPGVTKSGNTNGVSAKRIVVGGIASLSGPLPADFAPVFDGVRSYLSMVNARGGVNGRKIDFAHGLDDGSNPSQDTVQARTLVQVDHVFAVVGVATPSFSGASFLAANGVPTFGYNVNHQWADGPSLFGAGGSVLDFEHPGPEPAYLAQRLGVRRVGIVSYSVTQSQQACTGVANVMHAHGIDVAFEDLSNVAPAVDLTSDVNRMHRAGVQLVASCLDLAGNLVLSRTMHAAGMGSVAQYWLNGYDESAIDSNAPLMNGAYFLINHVPFESGRSQPKRYSEMALYLKELHRYYPNDPPGEASLAGWISAVTFVDGLRAIGRDATRERLVSALNSLTSYTAHGLIAPVDWRTAHEQVGTTDCNVFLQARGGHFVPIFGSKKTVFTCFAYPQPKREKVVLAAPPRNIPGA
ncbi:MAG: ABC transporter substrate-binding protein [Acidimicrobiales bacterium]